MNLRELLQNGSGRFVISFVFFAGGVAGCIYFWPHDESIQEKLLSGFQRTAFVAAAFSVTAYNLRVRVVDLVLKVKGSPAKVAEFCRIARAAGKTLTGLVIFFTLTALGMASLTLFQTGTVAAEFATALSVGAFATSMVSLIYVFFSFERVERFALDEAEDSAHRDEADRLFGRREIESVGQAHSHVG